jgi:hypothetical protein
MNVTAERTSATIEKMSDVTRIIWQSHRALVDGTDEAEAAERYETLLREPKEQLTCLPEMS